MVTQTIEPQKKVVTIGDTIYEFNLLGARQGGKIIAKLLGKLGSIVTIFHATSSVDNLDHQIQSFFSDDTMDSLYELIFAQQANLRVNGQKILDPDTYFQGKYVDMMRLCVEAARANGAEDFFTFISGLLNLEKVNFSEMLKDIQTQLISPQEIQSDI